MAFNPQSVFQGLKALTELYRLIKEKKVDSAKLDEIGDNIQSIVASVNEAKRKK